MSNHNFKRHKELWGSFRLSVVGNLLVSPPPNGKLKSALKSLSQKDWKHPVTEEPVRFSFSTIEEWYYKAKSDRKSPVKALERKIRKDGGLFRSISVSVRKAIRTQHDMHSNWSHQLHYDNLKVLATKNNWQPFPSYSTIRRYRTANGLIRVKKPGCKFGFMNKVNNDTSLQSRETRRFESSVGCLARPQSNVSDFYRELGDLFGIPFSITNKFGGFKSLRERWQTHIETTTSRPILIFDEAQMAQQAVLSELRLLSSTQFDSASILTVLLIGDERLLQLLQSPELRPLESRIRFRMNMELVDKKELSNFINHCLDSAGNSKLFTQSVIASLAEHAGGNYRTLINLANELLNAAIIKEVAVVDEKLYFDTFSYHADKFKSKSRR